MRHRPALDGLRGVAVLAVLGYHLWPERFPGGFLGVEAFFTLSGFLITTLLLTEHRTEGGISLPAFWSRRAKRLLPALFVLLALTVAFAAAVLPATSRDGLRADGLAALGYVSNWWQIVDGQSYFDLTTGASPLAHLWSLAVEEQFYVVWPLIVAVCLWRGRRWPLAVVCLGGAAASFALMAALDPARAYLGTDTRAGGLLLGAALAVWLERREVPRLAGPFAVLAAAGWVAATALVDERAAGLYRGGFAAFGLGIVALVAAAVSTRPSWAQAALAVRPLRAVGRVSYGLYLWHWPVIVLLTAGRTGLTGASLTAARLGAMAALTLASYRVVEQPVRTGRLPRPVARLAVPAGAVAVAACLVASTVGGEPPPAYAVAAVPTEAAPLVTVPPAPTTVPAPVPVPGRILLVGDSVAYTLRDAMGEAVAARGSTFSAATFPGCGMVGAVPLGRDGVEVEWAAACEEAVVGNHEAVIRDFDPDLVVWLSTWESLDRRVDGELLRFGDPALDRWLLTSMQDTVGRLTAGGARLVILTIPPEIDAADADRSPEWNADLRHLNDLFRRLAGVRIADFAELVCPGGRCEDPVDGVAIRPDDGVHFSPDGARWVSGPMLDAVLEAAR